MDEKNVNLKRLLTIQDISCVGQCSATVALPVISCFGVECSVLPTAVLSTHTAGFSGYTCLSLTDEMPKILKHWEKENITFDAFYTGYLCGNEQIENVKNIVSSRKTEESMFIVDPVMADNGKFYIGFDEAFAEKMRGLCSMADVIIPNITEACFLTKTEIKLFGYDKGYIENLMRSLKQTGAKNVILTGVCFDNENLGVAVSGENSSEIFYYFNKRIPHNFHGTGDVYSSCVAGGITVGLTIEQSAALAVDFTVEAMKHTYDVRNEHWYGVCFEKALPFLIEKLNGFDSRSANSRL